MNKYLQFNVSHKLQIAASAAQLENCILLHKDTDKWFLWRFITAKILSL